MIELIVLITLPIWLPPIVLYAAHDVNQSMTHTNYSSRRDPLDSLDGYNDCPNCGSGDTDGNHCFDCDEDY